MNANTVLASILSALIFATPASGVEFELKQKVKSRSSEPVITLNLDDGGNFVDQEVRLKNRKVYQARFLFKFDPIIWDISPYFQLGYERERIVVEQRYRTSLASFNRSYHEFVSGKFAGFGFKYKFKEALFSESIKLDVRFDRWLSIDVERSQLAPNAEPLSGSFSAYENKIKIEALYASPYEQIKFQPRLEYSFYRQRAWRNDFDINDLQLKEKSHELEARFLITWIPEHIKNLELSLGPEIVIEHASELTPGVGWESERDDVTLLTFLGTYELENYPLEFELWLNHQLDGKLKGENNLEFKFDWSF